MKPEKSVSSPSKYRFTAATDSTTSGVGAPRSGAGQPAQESSFGRVRAFCRQLKARDAHVIPGDAAKAAFRVENEIMVRCLAHHMALAFRSTIELVEPGREFNPILAAIVSPESLVRPDISTQVVVLD